VQEFLENAGIQMYIAARKAGKSINAWMDDVLGRAAAEALADRQ
jgi:predicted HicB family RNase H-like nuclease